MLKLEEISEIVKLKADVPLYYMNTYQARANFFDEKNIAIKMPISFMLEMEPTGFKKIDIKVEESVDYPLLPLIKMLKEEITRLDREGKLPW